MGTLTIPAPSLPIPANCDDMYVLPFAVSSVNELQVECETGKVSDGYHTFDELYDHRCLLFLAFMREYGGWKSRKHHDGSLFDGWFIAGIQMPAGQISYHIPDKYWDLCTGDDRKTAPEWDGHTPADVLARIEEWLKN